MACLARSSSTGSSISRAVPPYVRSPRWIRTLGLARMFHTHADTAVGRSIASSGGRSAMMYTLFPCRIARMHLRCRLPLLRPVVVITAKPTGACGHNSGSIIALRMRPSLSERNSRRCFGASSRAACWIAPARAAAVPSAPVLFVISAISPSPLGRVVRPNHGPIGP